jgi:integrase
MRLSDNDVEAARRERTPYRLTDGRGLYVLVQPNGSKYWRYDYRFNDKRLTLSLGVFPDVQIEEARKAHLKARASIKAGVDPSAERRLEKLRAPITKANTFGEVADELLAKLQRERKAEVTIRKRRWLLKTLAEPLCPIPVDRITAPDVLAILRKVEAEGKLESARRLRAAIGQVMRRAVASGLAAHDPTPALRGEIATPTVKHRAAITHPKEFGRLVRAIQGYDRPMMRCALVLLAYCFPRPGELRLAQWNEVHLKERVWIVPETRAKMRRAHRIPLSPQAIAIFKELKEITGDGRLCFPGERSSTRSISDNSLNAALRTLGYDGETHTAHGFRASASSLLNEHSDFSSDAIELTLGHQDANAVRRAYHRSTHWKEREALMAWWADYVDALARRRTVSELLGPERM